MLDFITAFEAYPDPRVAYGLISVGRLCLLSQNHWTSNRWLTIGYHVDPGHYVVEVRMPIEERPWPDSKLRYDVFDFERLIEIVVDGLDYTRGWEETVGGAPIGLGEIIEEELSRFSKLEDAATACRLMLGRSYNETRSCALTESEVTVTVLAQIDEEQVLAYRHDIWRSYFQWGVLPADLGSEASMGNAQNWYSSLRDAFLSSNGWSGNLPIGFTPRRASEKDFRE